MALQVWLPLLGNLNNQGLSDHIFTNDNATISSTGKLGQCYSFDGISARISDTTSYTYTYPLSISVWIYPTLIDSNTRYIVSITPDNGGFTEQIATLAFRSGQLSYCVGGVVTLYSTIAINNWYHLVLTISEDKKYTFYLNGVSVATGTCNNKTGCKWLTIGARSTSSTGGSGGAG